MPILSNQPQQTENQQPVGRRERGTGFTNIGRLLGANVGAGEQMGQTIGSTIGGKAGQLKADVSKAGSEFQKRFGESVGQAQDVFGKASDLIPSSPTGISSGLSGMKEDEAKELGTKLYEARTYKGPSSLEGQEQIGARAKSVAGMGELAKAGSAGQGLLMQNIAGKAKPYTRGQSALDTLLMGQSKEAQKAIREGAGQTYGAEQTAQTAITGAEQQAKEASRSLGKQYSDILKQASQSGQDISKYGEEKAKDFYKDATRLQELMTNIGKVDSQTGKPLIDPATLSEKDKDLIRNASEYGVDTSGTFVDPRERYSNISKNILSNIASKANVVPIEGAMRLTGDETSALKNLALLGQQAAPSVNEFNTKVFPSEKSAYQASLNQLKDEQDLALAELETQAVQNILKYIYPLETRQGFTSSGGLDLRVPGAVIPAEHKNLQFWKDLANRGDTSITFAPGRSRSFDVNRVRNMLSDYASADTSEKLAQKGITLGDYLKNLYGINTPTSSGQV